MSKKKNTKKPAVVYEFKKHFGTLTMIRHIKRAIFNMYRKKYNYEIFKPCRMHPGRMNLLKHGT